MSVDSRSPLRALRRKKEDERPDYSEPDFTGWGAKLDDFIPAAKAAPAKAAATSAPAAPVAPAAEPAAVVEPAPAVEAVDNRPSLEKVLETLLSFDGALCVAVVDSDSGMILGKAGSGVEMDLAAANASVILRARLASTRRWGRRKRSMTC